MPTKKEMEREAKLTKELTAIQKELAKAAKKIAQLEKRINK